MREYVCWDCRDAVNLTAFGECPQCHGQNVERIHSRVVSHAQEMTGIQEEQRL